MPGTLAEPVETRRRRHAGGYAVLGRRCRIFSATASAASWRIFLVTLW
ncbi:hypothetical protein [Micromonospora sp. NBRC 110038]|nr:hypothetical protein [Micromonospora sp. NBRC 110038]